MKPLLDFLIESKFEKTDVSPNKGILFEKQYVKNFEKKYREGLEDFLGLEHGTLKGATLDILGGQNNKRPLTQEGDFIFLGSKLDRATVGDDVVDILLKKGRGQGKTVLNLSLKSGETVTFCNAGISLLFPKTAFTDYESTGKFIPGEVGSCSGADLLDLFGIDPNRFASVFVNYSKEKSKRKAEKDFVDITNYLNGKKDIFNKFVESVVGYGYILVHEKRDEIHYQDLRTPEQMRDFIGILKHAEIQYPKNGEAKRINIIAEFSNGLKIIFNIRDKSGGVFPTGLMADYKVSH